MKYTLIIFCSFIFIVLSGCKKKVPTSIDDLYTNFVDDPINGKYNLIMDYCNGINRYAIDLGAGTDVTGYPEYHRLSVSTVPNDELPWYFQKLKNGKFIIYSKRKNGLYYLWSFRDFTATQTAVSFPKPSRLMLMKEVGPTLPINPSEEFQFRILPQSGNFFNIKIYNGSEFISYYYSGIKKPNQSICDGNSAVSIGGLLICSLGSEEKLDGLGNNWQYVFVQSIFYQKLP